MRSMAQSCRCSGPLGLSSPCGPAGGRNWRIAEPSEKKPRLGACHLRSTTRTPISTFTSSVFFDLSRCFGGHIPFGNCPRCAMELSTKQAGGKVGAYRCPMDRKCFELRVKCSNCGMTSVSVDAAELFILPGLNTIPELFERDSPCS